GAMLCGALLLPNRADAAPRGRSGPGWSNAPRWRLPAQRAPDCPHGYAGNRALVQVSDARCTETGPQRQPARKPKPAAPSARPAPSSRPAPPAAPTPTPTPTRPWTPRGTPDATALM